MLNTLERAYFDESNFVEHVLPLPPKHIPIKFCETLKII